MKQSYDCVYHQQKKMCIGTVELLFSLKRRKSCPVVAQLVRALSHKLKGHRFDSQPGYKPRLQVQSLVRAHMGGNQSMFLSHIDVSLSLSLSVSVSPGSLSL